MRKEFWMRSSTGYKDVKGNPIYVGDVLYCRWDYFVMVCRDDKGEIFGKLMCSPQHPCEHLRYDINEGKEHIQLWEVDLRNEISGEFRDRTFIYE